jgi:hypothetical protein
MDLVVMGLRSARQGESVLTVPFISTGATWAPTNGG